MLVLTKEEAKRRVLDYLESKAVEKSAFEDFTMPKIIAALQDNSKVIERALDELQQENLIEGRHMQVPLYVPTTRTGKGVRKTLAQSGFLTYSPYWATLFALGLLYLAVSYYPSPIKPGSDVINIDDAYKSGILAGVFYSGVAALILGYLIRRGVTEFRKWQIVSEEVYELVAKISKYTVYLSIGLVVAYYIASVYTGYPFEATIAVAIIGIIATTVTSIQGILYRQNERNAV